MNIVKARIPIQVYVESYSSGELAVHEGLLNRNFWEITHIESGENICDTNIFPREKLENAINFMEKLINKASEKNLNWKDYLIKKSEYQNIINEIIESYSRDFNYKEDYHLLKSSTMLLVNEDMLFDDEDIQINDEDAQIDYEDAPLDDDDYPF